MKNYLHVRTGPHDLLLDLDQVVEIGAIPADARAAAGHRTWRDRSLPAVDLGALLGTPSPQPREQVVVHGHAGDAGNLAVVDVDAVVGIRALRDEDLFVFPLLADALVQRVDLAWLDRESGRCLLRLRHPLTLDAYTGPEN